MRIDSLIGDVKAIPGNLDGRYKIEDAVLESGDAFSVKVVDRLSGVVVTLALDKIFSDTWMLGQKADRIDAPLGVEEVVIPVQEQDLRKEVADPARVQGDKYLLFLVGIVDKVREIVLGQPDKWETVNPAIPASTFIPEELTRVDYSDGYGIMVVDARINGKQREIHLNKANEFFSIFKAEMPVFEMSFFSKDGINDSLKCDLSKVEGENIGTIADELSNGIYNNNIRAKQAFADMIKVAIGYLDPSVPGTDFILTCSSVTISHSFKSSGICIYPMLYKTLNIRVNPDNETDRFSEQFVYDKARLERLVLSLEGTHVLREDNFISRHYSEILDVAKKALEEMNRCCQEESKPVDVERSCQVDTIIHYDHTSGYYKRFEVVGHLTRGLVDKLLDVIRKETDE